MRSQAELRDQCCRSTGRGRADRAQPGREPRLRPGRPVLGREDERVRGALRLVPRSTGSRASQRLAGSTEVPWRVTQCRQAMQPLGAPINDQ